MLCVDGVQRKAAAPTVLSLRSDRPLPEASAVAIRAFDGIIIPRPAPVAEAVLSAASDQPFGPAKRNVIPMITVALAVPLTLAIGWTLVNRRLTLPTLQAKTQPATALVTAPTSAAATATNTNATAAAAGQVKLQSQALQNTLDGFAAKYPGSFGLYVQDLKTGAVAASGADRVVESASLYKLFVAQTILKMVDSGQLSLGAPAGNGTGMNVQDCLNLMITISSNECGHALGNIIGWEKQDAALRDFGYKNTSLGAHGEPNTTAADVATFFNRLYAGTMLSPSSHELLLSMLKNQRVNDRLPTGLPADTVIAHKTGDLDGFMHDAGIIYGPKTDYLVVAISGPWKSPGTSPAKFTELSQALWQQLQQ